MDTVALRERFERRAATVGIVGLGYVGLPLAVAFAEAGFDVVGLDVAAARVEALNAGTSHIPDVPSDAVAALVAAGRFRATTDAAELAAADAISICVPTPLSKTRDPDLGYVIAAVERIAGSLRPGQVIVLESTTYPGTTREVILPRLQATGLVAGTDVFVAFSPERIDPGNRTYGIRNTPKVVGGLDPASTDLAVALYGQIIDLVVPMSSPEAAEMVKLLENTFRAVNIALANEVALMSDRLGINVWEVIRAAATKPFGFMPFYPGPGIGGHCIPLDPYYLSWKMKTLNYRARFIELAGEVNAEMPYHVVDKIADALNDVERSVRGAGILVLGVAYKPDIDDARESPALDIIGLLREKGARVAFSDPHVGSVTVLGETYASVELTPETVAAADCVVIVTDHAAFDYRLVATARAVVDTRDALRRAGVEAPHAIGI